MVTAELKRPVAEKFVGWWVVLKLAVKALGPLAPGALKQRKNYVEPRRVAHKRLNTGKPIPSGIHCSSQRRDCLYTHTEE